jgi:hypothetical protein
LFSPSRTKLSVPHPNIVISTEGGAFAAAVEKSAVAFVVCSCGCLFSSPSPKLCHFDRRRRILPPQWRNLLFARSDLN